MGKIKVRSRKALTRKQRKAMISDCMRKDKSMEEYHLKHNTDTYPLTKKDLVELDDDKLYDQWYALTQGGNH